MPAHGVDRTGAAGGSGSGADAITEEIIAAKGDLIVGVASDDPDILTVGANDTILVADSNQGEGMKWAAGDAAFQAIINGATAETSPAAGDIVMLSDVSLSPDNGRKMTLQNLLKVVNDLTADGSPSSADYMLTYDVDASASKKVLLSSLQAALGLRTAASLSAVTTTLSGTSTDITGISSSAKRVVITIDGASTNGTTAIQALLGISTGPEATGYVGANAAIGAAAASSATLSTGIDFFSSNAASNTWNGVLILTRKVSTTNVWSFLLVVGRSSVAGFGISAGTKSLAGVLDRVRFTAGGVDTFDAGTLSILTED